LDEYHPNVKTDHLGIHAIDKDDEDLQEISSSESKPDFDVSDSSDDDENL
jgi:hypothetical protein